MFPDWEAVRYNTHWFKVRNKELEVRERQKTQAQKERGKREKKEGIARGAADRPVRVRDRCYRSSRSEK